MPKRLSGWLLGAAVGVLFGGILAMDAVADAQAATLLVEVEVGGAPTDARVEVHSVDGTLVAEGPASAPLRVPPGTYDVRVSCPAVRAERVLHAVVLAARGTARRVVRFTSPR